MHHLNYVLLSNICIHQQLQIEEALLRTSNENWLIINQGSSPSIVMGISGKPEKLINLELLLQQPIPLIKRFSGGGTVVVDEDTLFCTFIGQHHILPKLRAYPLDIMNWVWNFYKTALLPAKCELIEQDFTWQHRKFAGNAQSITKDRWLQHSSFLWKFKEENMKYLLMPEKVPSYRKRRKHTDFMCEMHTFLDSHDTFTQKLIKELNSTFILVQKDLEYVNTFLDLPHRKMTQEIKRLPIGALQERVQHGL